jgi:2-dehydro-3-deoxyphosphogalactonate aldolase
MAAPTFPQALARFPLIAILRGVRPEEAVPLGEVLVEAGFAIIEVPLNSPDPFESIARLARALPDTLVGAGTVTSPADADRVAEAGGRIVLMPHGDGAVVRHAKTLGLACVPGVATPTEAYAALANGADALKMFPAEALPPSVVKAWRAVLPPGTMLLPVGGIVPASLRPFTEAGAAGFGLGSALYKPGMTPDAVAKTAKDFAAAVHDLGASGGRV